MVILVSLYRSPSYDTVEFEHFFTIEDKQLESLITVHGFDQFIIQPYHLLP